MHSALLDFGWTESFDRAFEAFRQDDFHAGRVLLDRRRFYTLHTEFGVVQARLAGSLVHEAENASGLPVVGDWVALRRAPDGTAVIRHVLPRRSKLSRNEAGRRTAEQVVAANVDTALLVMGLDGDFNLRRLERLLVTAREGGTHPLVVLNKADLDTDIEGRLQAVEAVASGAPVVVLSCLSGQGIETLRSRLEPRRTFAVLGSSGVGKSTLINRLLGKDLLATGAVRASDDRGRHTTTHRELLRLPDGPLLIDSPGIRELQLWNASGGLENTFDDLEALASTCRFRDCTHRDEPGCAVRRAVGDGTLEAGRLRNFHDLEKEQRALEIRQNNAARRQAGKRTQAMVRDAKKAKAKRRSW